MAGSILGNFLGYTHPGYPGKLSLVLFLGVALLAKSSSVDLLVSMLTVGRSVGSAIAVVATIAHTTGVVLRLGMTAPGDRGWFLTLPHTLLLS